MRENFLPFFFLFEGTFYLLEEMRMHVKKKIVIKYKVKIIIKKYYLNQMKCIIDNLMWVLSRSGRVKHKNLSFYAKMDRKFYKD